MALSNTVVDRLGKRLKRAACSESDLRLLNEFRLSFDEAYHAVIKRIADRGEVRSARIKTTQSIAEKLGRESIRLSQMQDIAGCRVIVANVAEQDRFVQSILTELATSYVTDRREKPSFGYRAVHVIAEVSGRPVEIQVRTWLQHLWAQISEKLSDVLDSAIKHGGGPELVRGFLAKISEKIAVHENHEKWGNDFLGRFYTAIDSPRHIPEVIDLIYDSMRQKEQAIPWFAEHYPLLFRAWMSARDSKEHFPELPAQPRLVVPPEHIDSDCRKELERLCQQVIEQTRRIIQDDYNEIDNLLNKVTSGLDNLRRPIQ
jgi:ppGpp synthetase/RelA/SpoT-type nucleotidyltranferase